MGLKPSSNPPCIGESTERGRANECRGGERHHRDGTNDYEEDAKPQVNALVTDEARRDPLVYDVALFERTTARERSSCPQWR